MLNLSEPSAVARPSGLMNASLVTQAPMRFGMIVITPASAVLPSRRRLPRIVTP